MWLKILALGIGGFVGSNLRYWICNWVTVHLNPYFPYGTLLVNAAGSFILGFFIVVDTEVVKISPLLKISIASGLIGALTTFSTFSTETFNFLSKSQYSAAVLNIVLNVSIGLCAVELGFIAAKTLIVPAQEVVMYKINN